MKIKLMKHYIIVLILSFSSSLHSQNTEAGRIKHFNTEKGLAIQGYDPIAYFTLKKGIKGKSTIQYKHLGVTYNFYSEQNKALFISNPSRFEPQYGGWCAFAMGDYGKKVEVDPETFKIVNDKLYLFYNAYLNNTLKDWNKDENNLRNKADKNWMNIIK